jgi:hypothetical protein
MTLATLILVATYIVVDAIRDIRLERRLSDIEDCVFYIYENHPELLDHIRVD